MRINRIRVTQIGSGAIAGIAVTASYGGQVALMEHWGVPAPYCYLIPLTVDVLALLANIARHTPELDRPGRVAGTVVLGLAGSVSITANLLHGANWGARIAYVWCVVAYLAAEYLVAKVTAAAARTTIAPSPVPAPAPATTVPTQSVPVAAAAPKPLLLSIGASYAPSLAPLPLGPARPPVQPVRVPALATAPDTVPDMATLPEAPVSAPPAVSVVEDAEPVEDPAVVAFRAAQPGLRRTSRLTRLNRPAPAAA